MFPIAQLINAALDATPAAGRTEASSEHRPRANILEGERDFRIVMDLPGVRNEDLEISVEGDHLSVKADRNLEIPEGYTDRRLELPGRIAWQRSFDLGSAIDVDRIRASLVHGILTLTLPKSEKTLPRRIQVQ